jgi:hypothetical protein
MSVYAGMSDRDTLPPTAKEAADLKRFEQTIRKSGEWRACLENLMRMASPPETESCSDVSSLVG